MKVVALGDSVTLSYGNKRSPWISHSWPKILERILSSQLGEYVEVVNSGVGGDTTRRVIERLDKDVFQYEPDILLIMFGLNDALNIYRSISVEEYENNLRTIIELASYRGIKAILMTPNPVTEKYIRYENGKSLKKLYLYVERVRKIAEDLRIPLIDIFKLFSEDDFYRDRLYDGVHPDYTGQSILASYIAHSLLNIKGCKTVKVRLHDLITVWADGMYNAFTDMIEWKGKYYITFRQGTHHFIPDAPDGKIIIVSSNDLKKWEKVAVLEVKGWDARDPKFLAFKDKLFLYTQSWSPEKRIHETFVFYTEDGFKWRGPFDCGEQVFWRPRIYKNKAYVVAYHPSKRGAWEGDVTRKMQIDLLETSDGIHWSKVTTMHRGNFVNETDILFIGDEALALARVEEWPRKTLILKSKYPFREWSVHVTNETLQCPLLLNYKGEIFALGRIYTISTKDKPFLPEFARTALFHLKNNMLKLLFEFPSAGDNAYPGAVFLPSEKIAISYYSSHEKYVNEVDTVNRYRGFIRDYAPNIYLAIFSLNF